MEITSSLITKTIIICFSKSLVFWPFEEYIKIKWMKKLDFKSSNGQNASDLLKEIITVLVPSDDGISKILLQI